MTDRTTRYIFDGDATGMENAARRAKRALQDTGDEAKRSSDKADTFSKSVEKNAGALNKVSGEIKKSIPSLLALSTTTSGASNAALGLAGNIAEGAKAFGPWGLALGTAAGLLVAFIDKTVQAADATEKLRKAEQLAEDDRRRRFAADVEADREQQDIAQMRRVYEQRKRIYEENQRTMREQYLREEEEKKKRRASAKKSASAEDLANAELFREQLAAARDARTGAGIVRPDLAYAEGLASARNAAIGGQMQRAGSDTRNLAATEARTNATLRQLDAERALQQTRTSFLGQELTDFDAELARIEREKQARIELLDVQQQAANTGAERIAIEQEMASVAHEATMQRYAAERDAEAQRISQIQAGVSIASSAAQQTVAGILSITDARRNAKNAALAQGKSEKEAARAGKIAALEQTASQLQAIRNMAIVKAIEQTAMGIGALASFNYPGAALHFAAAATWGVVAGGAGIGSRAVASRATSMRAADSGSAANGPGGMGGGSRGSSGSGGGRGATGSDSPIPGSPSPSAPAAGGGSGGGNTYVVQFTGPINNYGTPTREFFRVIDEGLAIHRQGSRTRRTGSG